MRLLFFARQHFFLFQFLGFFLMLLVKNTCMAQTLIPLNLPDTVAITNNLKLNAVSFRGLYVLNKNTFWCSGSKGVVGMSNDRGAHIAYKQLEKYVQSDFRDLHVFNEKTILLSSAGFPARIIKSTDAGKSWIEVFSSNDSAVFIDGIDFYGKKGLMLSDPIQGKFMVYVTENKGNTWHLLDTALAPKVPQGESAFAASGSSIQWIDNNSFAFVSGGVQSNLYCYHFRTKEWRVLHLPIIQGASAQGAFSFCKIKKQGISYLAIVGGDYTNDTLSQLNTCFCLVQMKPLMVKQLANQLPYQSSVIELSPNRLLTTGSNGTGTIYTNNKAISLGNLMKPGFHVAAKSKDGKLIILAGSKGRISLFCN